MSKANGGGFAAVDKRALSDEQYRKERLARKLEEARKKAAEKEKKEAEERQEQEQQTVAESAPAAVPEKVEKHHRVEIIREVPHVQPVDVKVDNHYSFAGTLWDRQQLKNDILCVVMGMALWALLGRKILWLLEP